MIKHYFPHFLAVVYVVFFIALGIAPVSREVWIAEVTPVVLIFLFLVVSYTKFRFSNFAYALVSIWIFWHTVGGHYTFANVPFGWVSEMIGSERNHFDRVGHFVIGFFAFAMAEWLLEKKYCDLKLALFFSLFYLIRPDKHKPREGLV